MSAHIAPALDIPAGAHCARSCGRPATVRVVIGMCPPDWLDMLERIDPDAGLLDHADWLCVYCALNEENTAP